MNRTEAAADYASDYDLDEEAVADEDDSERSDEDEFRPEKRASGAAANKGKGKGKGPAKPRAKGKGKAAAPPAANAGTKIRFTLGGGGGGDSSSASASTSRTPTLMTPGVAAEASGVIPGTSFRQDRDYGYLPLRPDQASRPFYIVPSTGHIILENFHPLAKYATDFLVAIAEPVSRPKHIHEYKLTPHSLYAAVSVGLETENIIEVLNRMSKVPVPDELCDFIRECTHSYGKVKMVLKQNKHFVESSDPETLRILLRDKVIAESRVPPEEQRARDGVAADGSGVPPGGTATYGLEKEKAPTRAGLVIPGTSKQVAANGKGDAANGGANGEPANSGRTQEEEDLFTAVVGLEKGQFLPGPSPCTPESLSADATVRCCAEDDMDDDDEVHSFEIRESEIEAVKRRCLDLDYRMMEEYDFRHDEVNPTLEIDLKPSAALRPYQEKSLGKMFGNG